MRWIFLFLLVWCGVAVSQSAVDVAGVRFPERARIGAAECLLNGAGLRSVLGVKLYAIGVYLPQKTGSTKEALSAQGAKRIQIFTMFDLTADMIAVGLVKGMRRNLAEAEFVALKERIETLRAAIHATDRAPGGSVIQLDWLPAPEGLGGATRLSVNGLQRGEDIPGEDFFQALLKVWMGERVNDAGLRDALLGRAAT